MLIARTDDARKKLNKINSNANKYGYYYRPRIFIEDLLTLNKDDIYITTACVAGFLRDETGFQEVFMPLYNHFGESLMLEVQAHNEDIQKEHNKKILQLSEKYGLKIIHANDSHYIYPEEASDRLEYLNGKGITYGEEDNFILDYPDYDTIVQRYKKQGVLNEYQVQQAIENTLILDDCECININKDIKMPNIYPGLKPEERYEKLEKLIYDRWDIEKKRVNKNKHQEYLDAIDFELNIIKETNEEVHTADYFLLNEKIVDVATNKYGGVLTKTGRGSGVSFYINRLLGFTGIDRLALNVPMYPTRFLSKSRLLETRSLPDFDFNTASPEPFIKATKEILGDNGCYWMVAYGTMKESEAFRNSCRNAGLHFSEYNEVAKNLEAYRDDKEWKDMIEHSGKFVDSIVSVSPHPCFLEDELVMTDKGYKKIARINKGDFVLTHTNQYKKVISTMENMSEDVYEIKAMGIPSTKATGNHPYYVREMTKKYNPKTQTDSRFFSNPIWKDVKDLSKNDYLGIAINQKNVIPRGKSLPYNVEEFWWIIGRYIGDGWYKNERKNNKQLGEYNTIICTGKHEIKQVTEVLDKLDGYFHYFVTEESTVFRINILCKELWDFVKQFGKGASNKRLTNTIFDLPTDLLKAFIKGYISANGYKQKDGLYSITTVSRELAYGISSCINKAYKRPAAITYHAKKDSFINKRKIIGKNQYIIKFREFPVKKEQAFYENGYIWTPFRKSTKLNIREKTYNIEVEDDHSYTINNAIVHNCANIIMDKNIEEEIGVIRIGDKICAVITSKEADDWKYLKNDYLTVLVVEIIDEVFKLLSEEVIDVPDLIDRLDDNVWDLYKNGITTTLNQVDSDFATNLVMKYKPTSYEELSSFVAAIRPGFASLLNIFINREEYSNGVKALDDLLKSTSNFMLYQESVMQYLVWLGVPEDITYGIIKKIAKKSLTKEEIEELHDQLLSKWVEKIGTEEGFMESWEVVENNSKYSFNASHSISVALDSLYGAYLKSNYPFEYYKVVLDKYRNDLDRTTKLTKELDYFNIKLKPARFRYSNANYTIDKSTNTIYKGVASIKNLNHEVAEQLYDLRHNKYNNFYELMLDIKKKVNIRSDQLDILIKLGYFEEFGKSKKLLDFVPYFNSLYKVKVVNKGKFNPDVEDIIANYSRQTNKQFRDLNNDKILMEIWDAIPDEDISIIDKISYEKEYLGYISYTNPNIDKRYVIVTNLDTRYSPKFMGYCLNNGKTEELKVYKQKRGRGISGVNTYYKNAPFEDGDLLYAKGFRCKPKSMKTENGWEDIPNTTEWWLIDYSIADVSRIEQ